jgi:hypothetical protein
MRNRLYLIHYASRPLPGLALLRISSDDYNRKREAALLR